jgi:S-adenosylmethionine:diacylglycerol 3-amino-3-carboxypropyl transferase
MYEDAAVERDAFEPGGRIFCIASAGCTALELAPRNEVVAVDINPVQLAYAERRIAGGGEVTGMAERLMNVARFFAPLAGWRRSRLERFLASDDPEEQLALWRSGLDTRRFRWAFDGLLSFTMLRAVYASPFLDFLPSRLGRVMRGRMERCFARHPNRDNPYARLLLLGEAVPKPVPDEAHDIRLEVADAASFLEEQPAGSFDGFSLSNILDGADDAYRQRLFAAVKRAAKPGATVVIRSFGEPSEALLTNRASEDRSMLWGIVDVRSAAGL